MKHDNINIVLIDDDVQVLKMYENILKHKNYNVIATSDSTKAIELIKSNNAGVVISDIIMPKLNGMELLQMIKMYNNSIQVIMLTAEGSIEGALESVNEGAFTYMAKPVDIEALLIMVERAMEFYTIRNENNLLREQMAEIVGFTPLIGKNKEIEEIRKKILTLAPTSTTVLITGESGTGKEIVANTIHYQSERAEKPFIKVNCAALTESLLESELFGHEKGSFTGAEKTHKGKFEIANNGTILLDEIGELSLNTQAKLLRVLQEKEFERVGGTTIIETNFRLLACTNKNLLEEVKKGRFREDLFYRINVLPINLPPLRKRVEDIPLLANYFLEQLSREMRKTLEPLSPEVLKIFEEYNWPGNVRELRNILERLVVMAYKSQITVEDIPLEIRCGGTEEQNNEIISLREARAEFEKQYIIRTLKQNNNSVAKASAVLDIAKKNLYRKINNYGININLNNDSD
ncbi:MAG: sigma-54 dependent transcriptional regulator [Eubacteriales bacterium]|nr:sigma-54 dependent transcriptional regulator [Eubacteriales bacterium]